MSIVLNSIKKLLGVDETNDAFDDDITDLINDALSRVKDLGAGKEGVVLRITDTTQWTDLFNDDETLQMIVGFVHLDVKLGFDPPETSFGINAIERRIEKKEWLITSKVEEGSPIEDDS